MLMLTCYPHSCFMSAYKSHTMETTKNDPRNNWDFSSACICQRSKSPPDNFCEIISSTTVCQSSPKVATSWFLLEIDQWLDWIPVITRTCPIKQFDAILLFHVNDDQIVDECCHPGINVCNIRMVLKWQ